MLDCLPYMYKAVKLGFLYSYITALVALQHQNQQSHQRIMDGQSRKDCASESTALCQD